VPRPKQRGAANGRIRRGANGFTRHAASTEVNKRLPAKARAKALFQRTGNDYSHVVPFHTAYAKCLGSLTGAPSIAHRRPWTERCRRDVFTAKGVLHFSAACW